MSITFAGGDDLLLLATPVSAHGGDGDATAAGAPCAGKAVVVTGSSAWYRVNNVSASAAVKSLDAGAGAGTDAGAGAAWC